MLVSLVPWNRCFLTTPQSNTLLSWLTMMVCVSVIHLEPSVFIYIHETWQDDVIYTSKHLWKIFQCARHIFLIHTFLCVLFCYLFQHIFLVILLDTIVYPLCCCNTRFPRCVTNKGWSYLTQIKSKKRTFSPPILEASQTFFIERTYSIYLILSNLFQLLQYLLFLRYDNNKTKHIIHCDALFRSLRQVLKVYSRLKRVTNSQIDKNTFNNRAV